MIKPYQFTKKNLSIPKKIKKNIYDQTDMVQNYHLLWGKQIELKDFEWQVSR